MTSPGTTFALLGPCEHDLVGNWVVANGRVVGDDVELRIRWLRQSSLQKIATANDGWDELFRDLRDGRLWEHTRPNSGMQGGGPSRLTLIDVKLAQAKYGSVSSPG